jgi:hypothetical protein
MRWARYVARMGEMRNAYSILVGRPEGNHLEDQVVDGRIILEWILGKRGRVWTGFIWLRIGTSDGFL